MCCQQLSRCHSSSSFAEWIYFSTAQSGVLLHLIRLFFFVFRYLAVEMRRVERRVSKSPGHTEASAWRLYASRPRGWRRFEGGEGILYLFSGLNS
jgi:hypothetical protein